MTATASASAAEQASGLREDLEREFREQADRYTDGLLPRELLPELVKSLHEHGYSMDPPDMVTGALASEELARVFPSLEGSLMITQACARYIQAAGPAELRARAVPRLLAGTAVGCVASTEPNHGSNNAAMQTRAVLEGGDKYVINGRKRWISNADDSDYAVVLCDADTENGGRGIRPVIVERERSPYRTRDLPKMGLRAWGTSEIEFTDCRVPRENCIGPEGSLRNMQCVIDGLRWSRCRIGVIAVGLARAALDASVDYAGRRRQFGRRIGEFQLIQDKIATMATDIDAARLLIHRALAVLEEGRRCDREASMAKAYATEMAVRATSEAIQLHGANGLSPGYPLERLFRDARTLTIAEGTTEIHKLVVARSLLGLSAFQ